MVIINVSMNGNLEVMKQINNFMDNERIISLFSFSLFTSLFTSDKIFYSNILAFFIALIYYLNKYDDEE
jgi:hypothetical protein